MFTTTTAYDLGLARRAAAALLALLLVTVGATGWSHTDAPHAQVSDRI